VVAQGAAVSLRRERCNFDPPWARPEEVGGELTLWLRLRVKNDSTSPLLVFPPELRLQGERIDSEAAPEVKGPRSRVLGPAESQDVAVTFRQYGNSLSCTAPLTLSLDKFVRGAGRALPLRPISFVAEASDN
jgi:hypothetical protein